MITNDSLQPSTIKDRLQQYSLHHVDLPYQFFKGIKNKIVTNSVKKKEKSANLCYAISFLQLFLHCDDVINYFQTQNITNQNEILLNNIFIRIN